MSADDAQGAPSLRKGAPAARHSGNIWPAQLASWMPALDNEDWICRENVARFRKQLAVTQDERERAVLSALLAEHEARLKRLASAKTSDGRAVDR